MRRGIRFAARALVAAGALALTGQFVHASPPASAIVAGDGVAQNRATVLQVRLAWMADPALAIYPLGIRPTGTSFEVCGFVPDEACRARALQTARACVGHAVQDALVLEATLHPRAPSADADKMTRTGLKMLQTQMKIDNLFISVVGPGRLQIGGTVHSLDEKVTASHKLCLVPGCTSVANHLTVKTTTRHGEEVTPISADGNLVVRGPIGDPVAYAKLPPSVGKLAANPPSGGQAVKAMTATITTPAQGSTPPRSIMVQVGKPAATTTGPVVRDFPAPSTVALASQNEMAPLPYGVAKGLMGVERDCAPADERAVAKGMSGIEKVSMPIDARGAAKGMSGIEKDPTSVEGQAVAMPAVVIVQSPAGTQITVPAVATTASEDIPLVMPPTPMIMPRPVSPLLHSDPAVTPLTSNGKWPSAYSDKPIDHGSPSTVIMSDPVPSSGFAQMPEAPPLPNVPEPKARPTLDEPPTAQPEPQPAPVVMAPPAKLVPQVLSSSENAPAPAKAALAITEHPSMPTPSPEPANLPESVRVKHAIEAHCGTAVSRVQLFQQADHSVLVRVFLAKASVEKDVTDKLLETPEVLQAGYKLELLVPE